MKFVNNGTHLFSLIVFTESNNWVSIEFEPEPDECMVNLNDGWSFYSEQNPDQVLARDIKFVGVVMPENDAQNDLNIEAVFNNSMVYVEVVRQFDTGDGDGLDVSFYNGSVNLMQFASDEDHIGFHEDFYLLITDFLINPNSNDDNTTIPPIPTDIVINIPTGANLGQIKFILLGVTPIGILAFIGLHAARRVYTNPIEHKYNRIVDDKHNPPSFIERWRENFSSK